VIVAALRQQGLDGELVLEQNDGTRRLYWTGGDLIHLQSDVAGEQFGNYLLRQGILDFPALQELLGNDERFRLGEKVVLWGMMSVQERDLHLQSLQEQVMIHALEHKILNVTWTPGPMAERLSKDLHFKLDHRHFVWDTFKEAHGLGAVSDLLYDELDWRWEGRTNLLETVADLPLNPATAYALSFLGTEPISFEVFLSLSRLPEDDAARLLVTLWALGALALTKGRLPMVAPPAPAPPPPVVMAPPPPPAPVPAPTPAPLLPRILPPTPPSAIPFERITLELLPLNHQPEFLDQEPVRPVVPKPVPVPSEPGEMSPEEKAHKYYLKAKQFLLQERSSEAIRVLEQAVQLDPDSPAAFDTWLLLGRLRTINPAWSNRSIDALQTASRMRPKAAEPWAAMGEVYHRKGFKANAVACFNRALELDPSVAIPPDADLRVDDTGNLPPPSNSSLFKRFRSLLGGDKE